MTKESRAESTATTNVDVMLHEKSFQPYHVLSHTEQHLFDQYSGQIGACASFIGTMRDFNEGDRVSSLFLEHYAGMTEKVLVSLAERIKSDYRCLAVSLHHRVGEIHINESIVLIAAWSSHRAEAFAACQQAMERLKKDAPFWKREQILDQKAEQNSHGQSRWVAQNTSGEFKP